MRRFGHEIYSSVCLTQYLNQYQETLPQVTILSFLFVKIGVLKPFVEIGVFGVGLIKF